MSNELEKVKDAISDFIDDIDSDDYVIIDSDTSSKISKMIFGDITKASAAKQVAVGGVSGWISGYLVNKVGKAAALTVGTSILIIQLAQHNGYIKVDWTKVKRALTKASLEAEKEFKKNKQSYFANVKRFYRDNQFLATGFAGGFFFGCFI